MKVFNAAQSSRRSTYQRSTCPNYELAVFWVRPALIRRPSSISRERSIYVKKSAIR